MGRKLGLKSTVWPRRKKDTVNRNRMKNEEFKTNEERLRNLQDNFKCSSIQIIGCQKEKRKSKKWKTYLKT